MMRRHGLVSFILTVLTCFHLPREAAGDASDSFLGGQYQPTTNIDHIIQLTEVIGAIERNTNGLAQAESFYKLETHGLSLATISNSNEDNFSYSDPSHFLNQKVNPLYAIYMYGLWRGVHGNGNAGNDVPRESMKFLSKPVDFYPHTIIQAEFEKSSGYDAEVTAQTIRVTNMWMATVQSLYNGVQMCVERPDDYDEPNFVNPIDMAAAFWIGNQEEESAVGGGSLYAWAKDIGSKFTGQDANVQILQGLKSLQTTLQKCLTVPGNSESEAADMRAVADNITRWMTVPLVQSLLWHSTSLGDANKRDFVVLYGLMTLPPIIVCDDKAFSDLYDEYVVNVKDDTTPDSLTAARKKLESRYTCLGINCNMVGEAVFTLPGGACVDPELDIHGYVVANQELREVATVDLDVRTIGTLVEMNADEAANDIYHWGRFSRTGLQGGYYPLQKYATGQSHPSNAVATAFSNHFAQLTHPSDNIVDNAIMGKGAFTSEKPRVRRIIAEAAMVTILLHVYALDTMYEAIDDCDVNAWDRAVASLTGWAEGTANAKGLLFLSIGRFLCSRTASCEVSNSDHGEDSKVNKLIMLSLKIGRDSIEAAMCDEAKQEVSKIETLILTELVDATAYFAQQVVQNPSDDDSKADLYGVAWALIPLIKDSTAEQIIRTNVGLEVNNLSQPMVDQVLSALKTFVSEANISCTLLDTAICDAESLVPQTGLSGINSAADAGVSSQSLLSYTPSTNVESIIQLTVDIESIQKQSDKDASYKIYDKDDAVSLKHVSTDQYFSSWIRKGNPLFSLYMFSLWKSPNGGTADGGDKEFNDKPIEFFGNSIVEDEFNKPSGYNPQLTGETMRVVVMWMATVQSIYEGVEFCSDMTSADYPTRVNPIDKAAAFWIGNQQDTQSTDGGSLYAWTKRMHQLFGTPVFDANDEILKNLDKLRNGLDLCLGEPKLDGEKEEVLQSMWSVAKSTTTAMTVPLMQNLLHSLAIKAGKATSPGQDQVTINDSMILFALVTLPQLMVCDEAGFKDLYKSTILESSSFGSNLLSDTVAALQKNYACLEITCAQIGQAGFMVGDWPTCQDLSMFSIAGYDEVSLQTIDVAKVDIDVRAIGMLLEIEAYDAAANVFKHGGVYKDAIQGFSSIQSFASSPAQSDKGKELKELYKEAIANKIVLEAFDEESSTFKDLSNFQRRIMTEASIVAITLHIYALDSLFRADELCDTNGSGAVKSWDTAVAALVGWTEGSEDGGSSDNGVLFYNIAQYLCKKAGKCNMADDSEVNRSLISRLQEGKQQLLSKDCVGAYTQAMEIEKLLQTVLVDTVAFFAKQIVDDKLDTESVVEGYIFAEALTPIFDTLDQAASSVIRQNLGSFPNDDLMKDGMTAVYVALRSFVNRQAIDCALLTTPICQYTASTNTAPVIADNNGFLPGTGTNEDISPPDNQNDSNSLLGGAYTPTSNVDAILKLTDKITMIANADTADVARAYYTQSEDGISLKSLSTNVKWEGISKTNPLYVLYMYGFWNSDMGDSDGDGYSNKMFDDKPLLPFGDTIVADEMEKESGFDAKLTAETISLVNVWIAITSELYKAVAFCRDGTTNSGRNPIDDAAAFWFGSQTDPEATTGYSLFAWASRAQREFTGFSSGVNDEMIKMLSSLQDSYASCKTVTGDQRKDRALLMKTDVDYTTNIMIVPLVQNFIKSLASTSGMTTQALNDRDNYLVLYTLMVLPLISICDEVTFDDLWEDVMLLKKSFDASTFSTILKMVQDRFQCLGINCSMVGRSLEQDSTWPECIDNAPSNLLALAGYNPATDEPLSWSKIDLDISTILSLVVMEATPLAADIYNNGRNVDDTNTGKYFSIDGIRTPSTTDAQALWSSYLAEGSNGYSPTSITQHAIEGTTEFASTSPLKNSAAASLSLATIDMHIAALDIMYQAKTACTAKQQQQASSYWDRAVAITIGWAEGASEGGSETDGHLIFQIAQELCQHFDSCDEFGRSKINNLLVEAFSNGLQYVRTFQCDQLQSSITTIATLLQAILVDNLAFHTQFAGPENDDTHCLLAYVSANAIVPFLRAVDPQSANTVEAKIRVASNPLTCVVEDTDAIYSSLKTFVTSSSIDCTLLGSQVCGLDAGQSPIDVDQDSVYTSNNSGHTVANGEYVPDKDVEDLSNLKTIIQGICNAGDEVSAKSFYEDESAIGMSVKSMSLNAKYRMDDMLLFQQYVYALYDDVDKTDGSFMFDSRPATEYAHTIVNDAFDAGIINTGCLGVKVLHVWMWIVYKLQLAVEQCDDGIPENYGAIDEAATLWESGMLFDMAEDLGPRFGHEQMNGMTYLNRQIIDRFKKAQVYHQDTPNSCKDKNESGGLRIIVKEIVSYMTAVLIQQLIFAMVDYPDSSSTQEDMVELMSFAFLPRIMGCGHEMMYDDLYDKLATRNFDKSSIPFATTAIHSHLNCLGLSCDDIGTMSLTLTAPYPVCSDNLEIAGYVPVNPKSTNMIAKLDLDAVAINQMIQIEKYDIATNIYLEGDNYYDYDKEEFGFVSLRDMTQSATIDYTSFPKYELYSRYFNEKVADKTSPGDFAHQIFMDATSPDGRFANASTEQRRSVVEIALGSFVSYFSALEALYYAKSACPTNKDSATSAYDGGVAFLIGSVEGTERGGNSEQEGRFFYNVAKMACLYFDTCVEGGDTEINKKMLDTLILGQSALKSSNCDGVGAAIDNFATLTTVPLMQSLLSFADDNETEPDGYAASMAIVPVVWDFDTALSDKIVSEMTYGAVSPNKKSEVYGVINTMLADEEFKDIACNVISSFCDDGVSGGVDIPSEEPVPIKPEEPTPIAGGLYVGTSYTGDKSAIALDVKEIEERLQVKDTDRATFIYEEGMNSKIYDDNGMPTSEERSIQDFSLNSGRVMLRDPTYNLFISGLSDENKEFLGKPVEDYADSYVSTLLYSASPLAGDAMVAINIWMEVAHSLHSAYEACKSSVLSEGRSIDGRQLFEPNVAARFIDEAAAYWIGDGQSTGSSSRGHLLYALTEIISEEYDERASSQSTINTRIIDLLQQAKNHIVISRSCTTSTDSHLKLRNIIDEIIPLMAVPLLRALLHAMKQDDTERVKLYAIAVLPLFAKCNPSTYSELKSDLIDNTLLSTEKDYVYSRIVSLYDCLGLDCQLIGKSIGEDFAYRCEDGSNVKSLAGYRYVADQDVVSSAAKIDIEVRLLEIYMNNGMEHFPDDMGSLFGLAYERYRFGNGSLHREGSLSRLAKDVRRDIVPSFQQFRRYFKSDENYADKIIVDAFEEGGIFNKATADYRKRVILFTSKYMVTHMSILQKLYSAVKSCKDGNLDEGVTNLDTAAAYYTGSLEGPLDGGSFDGSLNFFLARRMCIYFDTCSQSNNALINERMISLFYSAQGELDTKACAPLERTVKQIDNALLVPLIQGTLFAAWQNNYYFNHNILIPSTKEFLPEGYVLAQSILPIIANVDVEAANEIKSVMVEDFPFQTREKVSNHAAVFAAVKRALTKMDGVDCRQIGSIGGQGFCPGDADPQSASSRLALSSIVILITVGLSLIMF